MQGLKRLKKNFLKNFNKISYKKFTIYSPINIGQKNKFDNNNNNNNDNNDNSIEYDETFLDISKLDKDSLYKPSQLFLINEFLEGIKYIEELDFKKAEKFFLKLKNELRESHISTKIYSIIIRRLGICYLQQNKIKEGLLELENTFEFSKSEENSIDDAFLALVELIKSYIIFDSKRVIKSLLQIFIKNLIKIKGYYFVQNLQTKKEGIELIRTFSYQQQAYIYYLICVNKSFFYFYFINFHIDFFIH